MYIRLHVSPFSNCSSISSPLTGLAQNPLSISLSSFSFASGIGVFAWIFDKESLVNKRSPLDFTSTVPPSFFPVLLIPDGIAVGDKSWSCDTILLSNT